MAPIFKDRFADPSVEDLQLLELQRELLGEAEIGENGESKRLRLAEETLETGLEVKESQ